MDIREAGACGVDVRKQVDGENEIEARAEVIAKVVSGSDRQRDIRQTDTALLGEANSLHDDVNSNERRNLARKRLREAADTAADLEHPGSTRDQLAIAQQSDEFVRRALEQGGIAERIKRDACGRRQLGRFIEGSRDGGGICCFTRLRVAVQNGENTAHLIERRGVAQCESVNGLNSSRAVPISRSTSVRYDFRQQR